MTDISKKGDWADLQASLVAFSLPPSDFASHRALVAFAQALRDEREEARRFFASELNALRAENARLKMLLEPTSFWNINNIECGVVTACRYRARLDPVPDSDSEDWWEFSAATEREVQDAIASELARRQALAGNDGEG